MTRINDIIVAMIAALAVAWAHESVQSSVARNPLAPRKIAAAINAILQKHRVRILIGLDLFGLFGTFMFLLHDALRPKPASTADTVGIAVTVLLCRHFYRNLHEDLDVPRHQ